MENLKDWKIFFVVNGHAGQGKAKKAWQMILPHVKVICPDFGWGYTPSAGSAVEMTRHAFDEGYDCVIGVGGDGTLHEVVNGYLLHDKPYKENTCISFWPLGTGCDTARVVYASREAAAMLDMLKNNKVMNFDVGKCRFNVSGGRSERYFINSCDAGLGADTALYTNTHSKTLGAKLSFLIAALVCLFKYDYCHMHIAVDDKELSGRYLLAAAGNGQYFGGGMRFVPEASFTDGKLDFLLACKASVLTVLSVLPKIYTGGHVGHPIAGIGTFRQMKVQAERAMTVELDGEIVGTTDMELEILPGVVQMLVPAAFEG